MTYQLPEHLRSEPWSQQLWTDVLQYGQLLDQLNHGIPREATVIDVGGNIGFAAILFQQKYNATVYAIEAIPKTFSSLQQNCSRYPKINPIQTAIGSEQGTISLYEYPLASGLGGLDVSRWSIWKGLIREFSLSLSLSNSANIVLFPFRCIGLLLWIFLATLIILTRRTVRVEQESLSSVLKKCHPTGDIDLIKIDIEGHELQALQGISTTDWARTNVLIMEIHAVNIEPTYRLLDEHNFAILKADSGPIKGPDSPRIVLAQRRLF